jgi:porin
VHHAKRATLVALAAVLSAGLATAALADDAPAQDSGVTLRLQYTGEAASNPVGGVHDGSLYMNNVDAQLGVDTNKALGWPGGKLLLEGLYGSTDSANHRFVGAVQDPSAIDTDGTAMFRLYQAYFDQRFGGTDVRVGIMDLETEFGETPPMDILFNGAYAWTSTLDQSGRNGPSTYPNTALGARLRQRIGAQWSVQVAVTDGVPDDPDHPKDNAVDFNGRNGAFLIGQVNFTPTRTTKLIAGVWDYTGQFDAISETNPDGSQREVFGSRGGYVGGATRLYSPGPHRGLDVFANVGIADARTNLIDTSFNTGLSYTGPLASRPQDQFGIAAGIVQATSQFKQMMRDAGGKPADYENNFEITYRAPISDWLTVQPDVQYWVHPGLDGGRKNDLLLLLHFEIGHLFEL